VAGEGLGASRGPASAAQSHQPSCLVQQIMHQPQCITVDLPCCLRAPGLVRYQPVTANKSSCVVPYISLLQPDLLRPSLFPDAVEAAHEAFMSIYPSASRSRLIHDAQHTPPHSSQVRWIEKISPLGTFRTRQILVLRRECYFSCSPYNHKMKDPRVFVVLPVISNSHDCRHNVVCHGECDGVISDASCKNEG
jgi:hypothetical protein